ncbi:MAG: DUF1232 domain-containing protein [Deltaproteobacteria bacterium]|nr:DUF1232 domain-containing protein [Deltaproteobacteria bacterium]
MLTRLKAIGTNLRREFQVYRLVLGDPRTPRLAKWFLALAVGYVALPFDLIPDFIPIIGHLDDLIIVPFLIILALKMIPSEVVEDCRAKASSFGQNTKNSLGVADP